MTSGGKRAMQRILCRSFWKISDFNTKRERFLIRQALIIKGDLH